MAGFSSNTTGANVVFADNVDFSGQSLPGNTVTQDGQLLIGSSVAPNIRVNKLSAGPGINITNGNGTITISDSGANDLHTALYIVSSAGTVGTGANFTTINAAIAAAQGSGINSTIFIMPGLTGVYIENFTLPPNINLSAFSCDGVNPNVTIKGKISISGTGNNSISGICLQTNGDFCIVHSGSTNLLRLINCFILASNNNAFSITSTTGAQFYCYFCRGDITDGASAYFTKTGNSKFKIWNSVFLNESSSATASSCSAAGLDILNSQFVNAISTSGAGLTANINNCVLDALTTTANSASYAIGNSSFSSLTMTGTGIATIKNSICSGTITINAGTTATLSNCSVQNITGAGTLNFAELSFPTASTTVNTTTQTALLTQKGAYRVALPAGDYTCLGTDEIVGATSSGARAITLMASPSTGQKVTIKDVTGTANIHNITITPASGTIDGAATTVINVNYGSVTLYYNGTEWNII